MNKILMVFLIVFLLINIVSVNADGFKVKYKPNNMSGNQMGFIFQVENISGSDIEWKDLKIFLQKLNLIQSKRLE